jgi:hypothetical protein
MLRLGEIQRFGLLHPLVGLAACVVGACEAQPSDTLTTSSAQLTVNPPVARPLRTQLDEGNLRATIAPRLREYLDSVPTGREQDYGFHSRDEFATAELGRPFAMFKLEQGPGVTFLNYWRVPVLVHGEERAIVDVRASDTGYKIVAFGFAPLAHALGRKAQHLGISTRGPANNAAILRWSDSIKDYLVCPSADEPTSIDEIRVRPLNHLPSSPTQQADSVTEAPCIAASNVAQNHGQIAGADQ